MTFSRDVGSELLVGGLLEPILLQPQIELSAREAEPLGGARPVPAAFAQDLSDRVTLDHAEIGRFHSTFIASQVIDLARDFGHIAHVPWPQPEEK